MLRELFFFVAVLLSAISVIHYMKIEAETAQTRGISVMVTAAGSFGEKQTEVVDAGKISR